MNCNSVNSNISSPIKRSFIRAFLGQEYYIFKRKINWLRSKNNWSSTRKETLLAHLHFEHKSKVLRQLQGVDMTLQENKRTNLGLAIEHLNQVVIEPGETFSLWKLVGRPTKRKGYLTGLVLKQGTVSEGIGGGLCQLGNLLFWIIAHSSLEITERHRHGFDVFPDVNRKVPFGAGATLSYNHIDFQFTNSTTQTFQIQLFLDDTHLNGRLLSSAPKQDEHRVEERNHLMKQQYWGGYSRHNQIVKISTNSKGQSTETLLVENHAIMMYNPIIPEKSSV